MQWSSQWQRFCHQQPRSPLLLRHSRSANLEDWKSMWLKLKWRKTFIVSRMQPPRMPFILVTVCMVLKLIFITKVKSSALGKQKNVKYNIHNSLAQRRLPPISSNMDSCQCSVDISVKILVFSSRLRFRKLHTVDTDALCLTLDCLQRMWSKPQTQKKAFIVLCVSKDKLQQRTQREDAFCVPADPKGKKSVVERADANH